MLIASIWGEVMTGPVNNIGGATALGTPCVQNVPTPAGTVPTPSVNNVVSTTATPQVDNILYGGMPIVNQMTENPISTGSLPNGGMVTAGLMEDSQNIGCSTVLNLGGMMATSTGDATGHNKDFNCVGSYIAPAPPCKWIVLR
jgi:hypothetical protein